MISAKKIKLKIDVIGNLITESTIYFFVIILNFIFTPLIEIEIFEKQFFALTKSFSKACFHHNVIKSKNILLFFLHASKREN